MIMLLFNCTKQKIKNLYIIGNIDFLWIGNKNIYFIYALNFRYINLI